MRLLGLVREDLARRGVLDAVLRDRELAADGLLAQRDVVLLRAGEVVEQVAVRLRRDDAQVEARPSLATTVAFVLPLATISSTHGSCVKCSISATGSLAVAMMSRARAPAPSTPADAARLAHLDGGRVLAELGNDSAYCRSAQTEGAASARSSSSAPRAP